VREQHQALFQKRLGSVVGGHQEGQSGQHQQVNVSVTSASATAAAAAAAAAAAVAMAAEASQHHQQSAISTYGQILPHQVRSFT
jgi:hypothetical protein